MCDRERYPLTMPDQCHEARCPYYDLLHALRGRLTMLETRVATVEDREPCGCAQAVQAVVAGTIATVGEEMDHREMLQRMGNPQ